MSEDYNKIDVLENLGKRLDLYIWHYNNLDSFSPFLFVALAIQENIKCVMHAFMNKNITI